MPLSVAWPSMTSIHSEYVSFVKERTLNDAIFYKLLKITIDPWMKILSVGLILMCEEFHAIVISSNYVMPQNVFNHKLFESIFTCLVGVREICNNRSFLSLENNEFIITFSIDYSSKFKLLATYTFYFLRSRSITRFS